MRKSFSSVYDNCIERSERVTWSISSLLPDSYKIEFDTKFVPNSLSGQEGLEFASSEDELRFNQIWGASYLNIFAFVEEYITLFALNLSVEASCSESNKLRAYVRFSEEEIKHQILFQKFVKKFKEGFPGDCEFLSNSREVASIILSNSKLCVLLLTYHLEVVTQDHYISTVQSEKDIYPKFREILKCHWLEESQHAKIDLAKLKEEFTDSSEEEFLISIEEYFNILEAFIGILKVQVDMNMTSLMNVSSNKTFYLEGNRIDFIKKKQLSSFVKTFLILGMDNTSFKDEVHKLSEKAFVKIEGKREELFSQFEKEWGNV